METYYNPQYNSEYEPMIRKQAPIGSGVSYEPHKTLRADYRDVLGESSPQNVSGSGRGETKNADNDFILSYIKENMGSVGAIAKYMLVLIGALIYLLTIVVILMQSGVGGAAIKNFLAIGIITKIIRSIPIAAWLILSILSIGLMSLAFEKTSNMALGLLGLVVIYYSMAAKKLNNCKQYLLTIAGLILTVYATYKMGWLNVLVSFNSIAIKSLFQYATLSSIILIIVNHFVYLPKCANTDR